MSTRERLYALLPAVVRTRDLGAGEPLRTLMAVLDGELAALRVATETMWDDWFVETCDEDRLALLAAALGVPVTAPPGGTNGYGPSRRAWVANTVRRRRRQGTVATLSDLAADVTRYPALAVELGARTAVTARVDTRGPAAAPGVADLRDPRRVAALGGAFDPFAHLADLRPLDGVARPRPAAVGLFLWRAQPQALVGAAARPVDGAPGAYRVDPLGHDIPLFHLPPVSGGGGRVRGPGDAPHPLRRLEARDALAAGAPPLAVRLPDGTPLTPRVTDLTDLSEPLPRPVRGEVLVDPELGRLVLADGQDHDHDGPVEVLVDHVHGAPGTLGACPADRSASWAQQLGDLLVDRVYRVDRDLPASGDADGGFARLADAVEAWNRDVAALAPAVQRGTVGLVAITDNRRHACPETALTVPGGARLFVVAGSGGPAPGEGMRPADVLPARARPHLVGDLRVHGTGADRAQTPGGVWLNGLLVDGAVRVEPGDLGRLGLAHCTVPGGVHVAIEPGGLNAGLEIDVSATIGGPVREQRPSDAPPARVSVAAVRVRGSVLSAPDPTATDPTSVDHATAAPDAFAVDLPGTVLELDRVTVLGGLRCRVLTADDSLLDPDGGDPGHVFLVEVRQEGGIRFSYVPDRARTPRRYACLPDLALGPRVDRAATVARLRPSYESRTPATPGYLVLAATSAAQLRAAASDGGEPGVWHDLGHTHRMAALAAAVPQSLRFGLQAGAVIDR